MSSRPIIKICAKCKKPYSYNPSTEVPTLLKKNLCPTCRLKALFGKK